MTSALKRKEGESEMLFTPTHSPLYIIYINSLLPGHKLGWPIFTTAHPVPGHERVKLHYTNLMKVHHKAYQIDIVCV